MTIETHTTFQPYSIEELTELSDVILKGEIISKSAALQLVENTPNVMTSYEISPSQFLKDEKSEKAEYVTVKALGGTYNNLVHYTGHPEFDIGDQVLLMLNLEPDTMYGNDYYISGVIDGSYKIKDNKATKSNSEKTVMSEKELVDKIQDELEK